MKLILALVAVLALVTEAAAERRGCADFKASLAAETADAGKKVAAPRFDKVAYRRDDGTMIRYNLDGIAGLSGSLICQPAERMHSFSASADISDPSEGELQIRRLEALAAAAICSARKSKNRQKCSAIARSGSAKAVRELVAERTRGEIAPSGESGDIDLGQGYTITFSAVPGAIMFIFFGPAR